MCSSTSSRALHATGPPPAGKGNRSVGESEYSSSDEEEQLEDLDAALEDVAVARSSSINASSGGGLDDSFSGASKMLPLPDDSTSKAAPGLPSWGELPNSRKFQFHAPSNAVPASLPISAGGTRRQLRPISELSAKTAITGGYTTDSKMVRALKCCFFWITYAYIRSLCRPWALKGALHKALS